MFSFTFTRFTFLFAFLFGIFLIVNVEAQQGQYKSCDANPGDRDLTVYGVAKTWETSDDKVFYLASGLGYCKYNYTDVSNVVCVSGGWFDDDPVSQCNVWVEVINMDNGVTTYGRIGDKCGVPVNSTFGCNDIYLSKRMFTQLAGNQATEALNSGHLRQVKWRRVVEPCWGLWANFPGKFPNGTIDDGFGYDSQGFKRCGRPQGEYRVTGPDVDKVCNINIQNCTQAYNIALQLPRYNSTEKKKH